MIKDISMKKLLLGAVLALASTSAFAETCKVTDPTGTPLKVRAKPYGKVLGTLKNGQVIYFTEHQIDKNGKPWVMAFDAKTDRYLGWVYREFVSCY